MRVKRHDLRGWVLQIENQSFIIGFTRHRQIAAIPAYIRPVQVGGRKNRERFSQPVGDGGRIVSSFQGTAGYQARLLNGEQAPPVRMENLRLRMLHGEGAK